MSSSRQLAAIMFTDIVGYTAMMQQNEEKAVAVIKHYNAALEKWVTHFNGQVINYYGDGSLCIFSSATDAVNCSLEVQKDLKTEPLVPLRIGLHIGEVFFEDEKALGNGVNVASRIQSLGQENTILISAEIHDKIKNNVSISAVSLGQFDFKNVGSAMEVFALTNEGLFVPQRKKMTGKLKKKNGKRKNILIALSLLIVIAAVFFILKNFVFNNESLITDKSIAVLPFVDMSSAKDQEYFSDGLSEELLNLLSKIPELKVIGRTSSFSFKGKNEDLRVIGKQLNVAHILEGSVQKEGNKIRVTAQLIRTTDGVHLWSEKYDRDLEGLFKLQDEIAGAVVKQLKLKLLKSPSNGTASTNVEVHNLILQGNYFYDKLDKENVAKALDFYFQALALDSLDARVWCVIARTYSRQAWQNYIPQNEGYEKARKSAEKAIALNDNLADGYSVLAGVQYYHDFDWGNAEITFQKALRLEPKNVHVLSSLGALALTLGHWDEASQYMKQALALDPLKPLFYSDEGAIFTYTNRLEKAVVSYKKILELNPQFQRAHMYLGRIYLLQGKPEMALTEMQQESMEVFKQFGLALAYHALGRRNETDAVLTNYIDTYQNDWPYLIAEVYAFRGEKNKAFEWLEKAYLKKDSWLIWLKGDPLLKNLEGDPRHKTFLKKMNLPID